MLVKILLITLLLFVNIIDTLAAEYNVDLINVKKRVRKYTKLRVLVIDFTSSFDPDLSFRLTNILRTEILKNNNFVIFRIDAEKNRVVSKKFKGKGTDFKKFIRYMGRKLGAHKVILGYVSGNKKNISVEIKVIRVSSGKIELVKKIIVKRTVIYKKIQALAKTLTHNMLKAARKEKKDILSYRLKFLIQGGEVVNYMSYVFTSPVVGSGFEFAGYFNNIGNFRLLIGYKIFAEKFIIKVKNSDHTIDSVKQKFELLMGYKTGSLNFFVKCNYDWVLRPDWPDLYQPNPLIYNQAFNLDNVKYDSTDRYSYHRIKPEIGLRYGIFKHTFVHTVAGYNKKLGYIDPNYTPAKLTHLTPDRYSRIYGEIRAIYQNKKNIFNFDVRNRYSIMSHDEKLSRDRITGLTHYSTTPNPKYEETRNTIHLNFIFTLDTVNLSLTPFYKYKINSDKYQGYYSYTEHDFGISVQQKFLNGRLKYFVKGEKRLRTYTSDGYGTSANHFPLTDGSALCKNYWVVNAEIDYMINENFIIFLKFFMKMKDTNYPSYIPGVNPTTDTTQPGTKNYEIDFSFDNYRIDLGIAYTI